MPKRKRDSFSELLLVTLPADVLAHIFTFLIQRKRALLSQTCKKLNSVRKLPHASLAAIVLWISPALFSEPGFATRADLLRQRPRSITLGIRPYRDYGEQARLLAEDLLRAWTPSLEAARLCWCFTTQRTNCPCVPCPWHTWTHLRELDLSWRRLNTTKETENELDFRPFSALTCLKVHVHGVVELRERFTGVMVRAPPQLRKLGLFGTSLPKEDYFGFSCLEELDCFALNLNDGDGVEIWNRLAVFRQLKRVAQCRLGTYYETGERLLSMPSLQECRISGVYSRLTLDLFRDATPRLQSLEVQHAHLNAFSEKSSHSCWRELTSLVLIHCFHGAQIDLLGELVRGAVLHRLHTDERSCTLPQALTHCPHLRFLRYRLQKWEADLALIAAFPELSALELKRGYHCARSTMWTKSPPPKAPALLSRLFEALIAKHGEARAFDMCSPDLQNALAATVRRRSLRSMIHLT